MPERAAHFSAEAYAYARNREEIKSALARIYQELGNVTVRIAPSFSLAGQVLPFEIKAGESGVLDSIVGGNQVDRALAASPTGEVGLLLALSSP